MRKIRLGPYCLTQRIGEGGSGVVYRATSARRRGDFAIKTIRRSLADEERFAEALLREARICGALDHPGIVRLYEAGEVGGEYFLAMEYVDGVSLEQLLARLAGAGRLMPAGLACHIAAEVARALEYAHSRLDDQGRPLGIVHRDVNPSNIMVTAGGRVKLLDFGIGTAVRAFPTIGTASGFIRGTLGYLSPEQAQGLPLDGRCDLYALGVVFYECLTGRRLFDDRDPLQTLRLLGGGNFMPPSVAEVDEGLDPDLDRLLARLLAGHRNHRHESGDAAAGDLEALARRLGGGDAAGLAALLAELPPAQPASGPWACPGSAGTGGTRALATPLRPIRRQQVARIALLIVALVGAGLVTGLWRWQRPSPAKPPDAKVTPGRLLMQIPPVSAAVCESIEPSAGTPAATGPRPAAPRA